MSNEELTRYTLGDEPPVHSDPERGIVTVYIDHGVVVDMTPSQARELVAALTTMADGLEHIVRIEDPEGVISGSGMKAVAHLGVDLEAAGFEQVSSFRVVCPPERREELEAIVRDHGGRIASNR
jgi:hypothetical protein